MASGAEVRRRIGVALRETGLDPAQSGRKLLELPCELYGITHRCGAAAPWAAPRSCQNQGR